MASIAVGVIGTGFGAQVLAPALQAVPDVQLAGIVGQDAEKTARAASRLGVERRYETWQQLIDDDRITAVAIAVPPARHYEMVEAALKAGRHVLCEKPFGLSADQAMDLVGMAERSRVVGMVDYMFRLAPECMRLKDLLRANAIGRIIRVNVEWTVRGRAAHAVQRSWQFDPEQGGGVLFGFGSHVVDYLEWLLGPVRSVAAHLGVQGAFHTQARQGQAVAEDTLDALLTIGEEIPVSVTVSNATSTGRGHWLTVYGEKGSLTVANPNLHDAVIGTGLFETAPGTSAMRPVQVEPLGEEPGITDGRVLLVRRLAQAFVSGIRNGGPVSPSFADGWRAQVVMEAIRAAHRHGCWTTVPSGAEAASSACRPGLNP